MFVESNVKFQNLDQLTKALKLIKRVGFGAVIITFDQLQFLSLINPKQKETNSNLNTKGRGRDRNAVSQSKNQNNSGNNNIIQEKEENSEIDTSRVKEISQLTDSEREADQTQQRDLSTQYLDKEQINKENGDDFDSEYDEKYEKARKGLFGIEGLLRKYGYEMDEQLQQIDIFQDIQRICRSDNIPFAIRVNIDSNNQEQLKRDLFKLDPFDILVSVTTTDKDCLVLASKDSRVDILSFITAQQIESAFKGAISQCYHSEKAIEIGFEPLILEKHANRAKLMRTYQKFFNLCRFPRDRIIATNAAGNLFGIRGPRELISIIQVLFHIPETHVKKLFREYQEMLLNRYYLIISHQLGEINVKFYEGPMPDLDEYDEDAKKSILREHNSKDSKEESSE